MEENPEEALLQDLFYEGDDCNEVFSGEGLWKTVKPFVYRPFTIEDLNRLINQAKNEKPLTFEERYFPHGIDSRLAKQFDAAIKREAARRNIQVKAKKSFTPNLQKAGSAKPSIYPPTPGVSDALRRYLLSS